MTSVRKIRANRANARTSTGPKTSAGSARASRNALRHGLTLPIVPDPGLSEEVEALAKEIAGKDANSEILALAWRVAEAQMDLRRVRCARHRLLSIALGCQYYESKQDTRNKMAFIRKLMQKNARDVPDEVVLDYVLSTPQGPDKHALILSQTKQLPALDRYEQRALSRRKFAIRVLDAARLTLALAEPQTVLRSPAIELVE